MLVTKNNVLKNYKGSNIVGFHLNIQENLDRSIPARIGCPPVICG